MPSSGGVSGVSLPGRSVITLAPSGRFSPTSVRAIDFPRCAPRGLSSVSSGAAAIARNEHEHKNAAIFHMWSPRGCGPSFHRHWDEVVHHRTGLHFIDTHLAIETSGGQVIAVGAESYCICPLVSFAGRHSFPALSLVNRYFARSARHGDPAAIRREGQRENRAVLHFEFPDQRGVIGDDHR